MSDQARDAVAAKWRGHLERPFPPRLRGEEIEGVDMVMIDADIAGCVDTWLAGSGPLDGWRLRVLRSCIDDVSRVLPMLEDRDEAAYYAGLRDLARAVLAAQ